MHLCRGGPPLIGTDAEECQQLKKKQKNRLAAQRSRQKHTDRADALHQQHESLERHNHALRKEIQALKAELAWWGHALHLHERLCGSHCDPFSWYSVEPDRDQTLQLPDQPAPQGHRDYQTPGSSPPAQQLSPGPSCHESPGLPSPLPFLSLDPSAMTEPPAQLSPSPVLSDSSLGSSLLGSFSKFRARVPSPPAQLAPSQPLGLQHSICERVASSFHTPPAALGPQGLSAPEADWQKLAAEPGLSLFPLLSSTKVHLQNALSKYPQLPDSPPTASGRCPS